jgi:hypothetical protein
MCGGYFSSFGRTTFLQDGELFETSIKLGLGDCVNLFHDEFRLLVKLVHAPPVQESPLDPLYRQGLSDLFFATQVDKKVFFGSLMCAVFLISCAVLGLLMRPDDRPKDFEFLAETYTLPFLGANNIKTSPEVLKQNLDRSNYIVSIVRYYRSIVYTLLDFADPFRLKLPYSIEKLRNPIRDYIKTLQLLKEQRIEKEASLEIDPTWSVLGVFSVVGESFQMQMLRMLKKIDSLHKGYHLLLESRRKVTEEFQQDPEYDWGQYNGKIETSFKAKIAGVKVFTHLTNEQAMYHEAELLGSRAGAYQVAYGKHAADKVKLSHKTLNKVIFLPKDLTEVSYVSSFEAFRGQVKLLALRGGGGKVKQNIEPIIGVIQPIEVQAVVEKNKFQIHQCYQDALRRDKNTSGSVGLSWIVDVKGKPLDITPVKNTVSDPIMLDCLTSSLASWLFPKPTKGRVRITHLFEFEINHG